MQSSAKRRSGIRIPPLVPPLVREESSAGLQRAGTGESPFITKGGTGLGGGSYERIRDPAGRDVVVVKGPSGSATTINLDNVKSTLQSLVPYADTPINSLPSTVREEFNAMVEISRVVYNTAVYHLFIDEVLAAFQNVNNVKEGTVGAFFKGCFVENRFEGPPGCDPRCAGSLPPAQGTPGWNYCDKPVLMYTSAGLNSLNELPPGANGDAYIVVDPRLMQNGQFAGFTQEDINNLTASGIKRVKIVYSGGDSYREYSNFVDVNSIPVSARGRQNDPINPINPLDPPNGESWGAVFAVLIVLVVVVLLVILATRYFRRR